MRTYLFGGQVRGDKVDFVSLLLEDVVHKLDLLVAVAEDDGAGPLELAQGVDQEAWRGQGRTRGDRTLFKLA